jgi:hypothetical protein
VAARIAIAVRAERTRRPRGVEEIPDRTRVDAETVARGSGAIMHVPRKSKLQRNRLSPISSEEYSWSDSSRQPAPGQGRQLWAHREGARPGWRAAGREFSCDWYLGTRKTLGFG